MTMKKEMIHRFPITTAHTTLIRQRETPTHEIIQSKNLTMSCCRHKESHPSRNLYFPNAFPREDGVRSILKLMVNGPSIELTTAIKALMQTVTPNILPNMKPLCLLIESAGRGGCNVTDYKKQSSSPFLNCMLAVEYKTPEGDVFIMFVDVLQIIKVMEIDKLNGCSLTSISSSEYHYLVSLFRKGAIFTEDIIWDFCLNLSCFFATYGLWAKWHLPPT